MRFPRRQRPARAASRRGHHVSPEALEPRRLFDAGAVSGVVFNDSDGDGVMNPWESGLGGWTVYVDSNANHFHDGEDPTAVSAPDGTFTIADVNPGTYVVLTDRPADWANTTVPIGARQATIVSGQTTTGIPLAVHVRYGDIGVTAYQDLDFDGTRDAGEPPLAGATFFSDVDHDGAQGPGEPSVVTDAAGRALFKDLVIGDYRITRTVPGGWSPISPSVAYQDVSLAANQVKEVAFGYAPGGALGSISGTVYNDLDVDHARDPGEPGLPDRIVFIDEDGDKFWDAGEQTATTNAEGRYTFSNLAPGTYYLMVHPMIGWMQTSPIEASQSPQYVVVTLAGGQGAGGRDFGTTQAFPSRISGFAYQDTNRNGQRDLGEPPMVGYGIYLDADNDRNLDSNEYFTITNPDGSYQLDNILPGTYSVRQRLLQSREQTEPAGGSDRAHVITLAPSGTSISGLNFGSVSQGTLARIAGFVFDDNNGNGNADPGESNLVPGRVVYIDADNDGVLDAGERSFTTQVDGYRFDSLAPGTYTVRVVVPPGMQQTQPANDAARVFTLIQGQQARGDFGLQPPPGGVISGTVYYDEDASGTQTSGDSGANNVVVYLDTDGDGTLDASERSARTDGAGRYSFAGLPAGQYLVRQVLVSELYGQTAPATRDPAGGPAGRSVTVAVGQTVSGVDFGSTNSIRLARAYGSVFDDANGNGVRDAGETAPAGYSVYLDTDNDGIFDPGEPSATQGVPGVSGYVLRDLLPGTYTVRALVPDGEVQSSPAAGAGQPVTLAMFQTAGPFDFGLAPAPRPTIVTFSPAADAYVRDGASANTEYGAATELQVKKTSSADLQRETYVRFDLSTLGAVTTAKLRLYGALQSASDESITIGAYPSGDVTWPESNVTWSTRPVAGATPLSLQTVSGTTPRWYEWDVTDYVRQQKAAGAAGATFALKGAANSSAYARFDSREATDAATRPQLVVEQGSGDTVAPTVREVVWRGSTWAPELLSFLSSAGMGDGGYRLPEPTPGAPAARTLPWSNPNTVTIRFSEDVRVQQDDLRLGGVAVPSYAILGFSYDPATFSATWTFAPDTATDRLRVELDGDGAGSVTDAAGNKLNGAADDVRSVDLLAGDATGDGVVNALDLAFIKSRLNRTTADATFNPFADLNGDGRTNALDVAAVKQRLARRLPPAPAPATSIPAPAPLFSLKVIDPHDELAALLG